MKKIGNPSSINIANPTNINNGESIISIISAQKRLSIILKRINGF